ncbi:O-antigen ligase family protein [Gammaproteobacteria bacterium]|nr:O-antigen ligase family protein [Gammaproteobacteria bacterium]
MPHILIFNPFFFIGHNIGLWSSIAVALAFAVLKCGSLQVKVKVFLPWLFMTLWISTLTLLADALPLISRLNFIWLSCFVPLLLVFVVKPCTRQRNIAFFITCALGLNIFAYLFKGNVEADFSGIYATGSILGGQASVISAMFFIRYVDQRCPADLLIFLAFLFLLLLSEHRGGMAALLAVILLRLSAEVRRPIFTIIGFGSIIGIIYYLLPSILDVLFKSGEISIDTLNTSGRMLMWQTLFDNWPDGLHRIFLGAGGGSARSVLINELNGFETGLVQPHNEYIRLSFDYGLIGLLLWLGFYYNVFKRHSDFGILIFVHFLVEALVSNILFWSLFYLTPVLFIKRRGSGNTR